MLPASVRVTQGAITLAAPATLASGDTLIKTQGDITLSGVSGATSHLTLSAGSGTLAIGLNDGSTLHQLNVASLSVTDAGAATLYGQIKGQGGATAATLIDSPLRDAPYFINDTPWGPAVVQVSTDIPQIISTTVPVSVVPSTPGASPLFTQVVLPSGLAPNALGAFAAPQVLSLTPSLVNHLPADDAAPADLGQITNAPGSVRPSGQPADDDERKRKTR